MRPHFGAALFSVLLAAVQAVAAEDRVTWYVTDHPPFFITEGPQAGQGSGDLQMRWLTAHLPNFDHHFEQVSTNRLLYDFEHQDGLCTINIIRTEERKKFMLFNNRPIPMSIWPARISLWAERSSPGSTLCFRRRRAGPIMSPSCRPG